MMRSRTLPLLAILICFSACEAPREAADAEPVEPPSPWRDGAVAATRADAPDPELEAAIMQARETAEEARTRWLRTTESLRTRWAVVWAAPTVDGGVEYVWVQPLHWSSFRIEGLLASDPVNELAISETRRDNADSVVPGDLVAFPIEELADWVHYLEGDPAGPREGGSTIDVLEARFGRPR